MSDSADGPQLAALLRAELEARGWQPADLERAIGARPGLASRWLTGETHPSPRYVGRLASVLGLDPLTVLRIAGYLDPAPTPPQPPADAAMAHRRRVWSRQFERLLDDASGRNAATIEAVINGWLEGLAAVIRGIERL